MAKKIKNMAKDVLKGVSSTLAFGIIRGAHKNVKELQKAGPSWTGRFSNSWKITTPDGSFSAGDGQEGEPRTIKIPLLTPAQAVKAIVFGGNNAVFKISNFNEWADIATDEKLDTFARPTEKPKTALGRSKWEIHQGSDNRPVPGKRGDVPNPLGPLDTGKSSRTAELFWFQTYLGSGKINRSVEIEVKKAFNKP
tara:strand:- start:2901 stop:3485 length:585 start_codon:yes stop_codon:yes gene_type:complete